MTARIRSSSIINFLPKGTRLASVTNCSSSSIKASTSSSSPSAALCGALSAVGAVEGMSLLQSHPDTRLILLDLNLPGMSGEEWIAWYLEQGKQTPVVVASGKGDILTITKGNNMTAALTKPFHMEELQELIEVLLADNWHEQVSVDKKTH